MIRFDFLLINITDLDAMNFSPPPPPQQGVARSISLSAPKFSSEDERLEREGLTTKEIESIQCDLYGSLSDEDEANTPSSSEMEEELRNELGKIPPEEKEAYLEALALCPDIVQAESNPILFLNTSSSPVIAAHRIVEYWAQRLTLFGRASAFLSITTEEAVDNTTRALLNEQVWRQLPNDVQGRSVIFYQCPSNQEHASQNRNSLVSKINSMPPDVGSSTLTNTNPHRLFSSKRFGSLFIEPYYNHNLNSKTL